MLIPKKIIKPNRAASFNVDHWAKVRFAATGDKAFNGIHLTFHKLFNQNLGLIFVTVLFVGGTNVAKNFVEYGFELIFVVHNTDQAAGGQASGFNNRGKADFVGDFSKSFGAGVAY